VRLFFLLDTDWLFFRSCLCSFLVLAAAACSAVVLCCCLLWPFSLLDFFLSLCPPPPLHPIRFGPSSVQELTADNFDAATADGNWLVEFYAPWCGHCNKFAADYTKVAATLAADPAVRVGRVDGSTHRSLSTRFSVTGFPSFFYLPPAAVAPEGGLLPAPDTPAPLRFTGGRAVDTLVEWARAGGAGGAPVAVTTPASVVERLLGRKGAATKAATAAGGGAAAVHVAVVAEAVRDAAEALDRWMVAQGGLTPEVRMGVLSATAVIVAASGLVGLIAVAAGLGGLVTAIAAAVTRRPRPAGAAGKRE